VSKYTVKISPRAEEDLLDLRAFDFVVITKAIEDKLGDEPLVRTKNRRPLDPTPEDLVRELLATRELVTAFPEIAAGIKAGLDAGLGYQMWQLRVGKWRALYAVVGLVVYVVRVVEKGRKTTGEALS
jgi:mRNA-degrading endonuclease RelE of RelBE toxin-antitoxin system